MCVHMYMYIYIYVYIYIEMYMIICVRMYHRRGARDIEKQQPGIAEVIADEPNVPDAFHSVLRSVVKDTLMHRTWLENDQIHPI